MKKVFFILGIHNHQPVGNFNHVLAEAFQKAYWPFLELLSQHPGVKVCLHYSGILWEWLEEEYPQMLDLCKTLFERGQIEFLSGGFYEPILSIIPDKDKLGQLNKMKDFLVRKFSFTPRGTWLAERVWEPGIPKCLFDAGLDYVIVDDLHFLAAGMEDKDLHGYYLTDDQGKVIRVFPGSKKLRYLIPFQPPENTLEYLSLIRASDGGDLAMMADDGEKFGIWPGTYKWVYEQKWLEHFFELIEKNREWLEMCTYSEYIAQHLPLGQVYLPTASYSEMEEWALPFKAQKQFHILLNTLNKDGFNPNFRDFIRGGMWRNFLTKYREGRNIYNRMLQVSKKIEEAENNLKKNSKTEDMPEWLMLAKNELWKGQCNDAYWHGLFGGLYLPHLRSALYAHLIQSDTLVDRHIHSEETWSEWEVRDMDQDGFDEIEVNTDKFCLFIDPNSGGSIYEWDFRPKCFNVINSLIRRPESYHEKILHPPCTEDTKATGEIKSIHDLESVSVEGGEKLLIYDHYYRNSLLEHFFDPLVTLDEFSSLHYQEKGDFLTRPYQFQIKKDSQKVEVELYSTSNIKPEGRLKLSKTFTVSPESSLVNVFYTLENVGDAEINSIFGVEFNFNLLAGRSDDRYFLMDRQPPAEPFLASQGECDAVETLCLIDKSLGIEIGIYVYQKAGVWRFPIETASNSEEGVEKVYQSSVILFRWPLLLQKNEVKTYKIDCWIHEI